jgi:DNA-binding MarR family transcriptional regulator
MTTTASEPNLELDSQLCFALYRASRAVIRSYGEALDDLGLTYLQYLTMMVLWQKAPQSVSEVGGLLHLDSGTLSPVLKRLEEAGFVERSRDPLDDRRVLIGLTREGKALRKRAEAVPSKVFSCMGLEMEEAQGLKAALHRLSDTLDEAEA